MSASFASSLKTEDHCSSSVCEGYDITKLQCGKKLAAIVEATKNDSSYIPSKLLDYLVSLTFDDSSLSSVAGCTNAETCSWVVADLKKRVEGGQYWTTLKVYSVLHELLWRGSNTFVRSMEKHGMSMLNFNAVVEYIRATTQDNVSGAPLPCTIGTHEPVAANPRTAFAAGVAPMKKRCEGKLFSCNKTKATTPPPPAQAANPCNRGSCQGDVCAPLLVVSSASDKDGELQNSNSGFVKLYQKQEDFLWSFLAYLEAFCQYRYRHPNVDLARSRLVSSAETTPTSMSDIKSVLDDTLELLKSTATSDLSMPPGCVLAMSIVRKRMNDARVLYNIACLVLLKMLEQLFLQARECLTQWCQLVASARSGSLADKEKDSLSRERSEEAVGSDVPTDSPTDPFGDSRSPASDVLQPTLSTHDVTEDGLRSRMISLFAQWYHALYQFDRTVEMLQLCCDEMEKTNGETYLVAAHLHRIPHKALDVIRELLKKVRDKGNCGSCRVLGECDLTSPMATSSHDSSAPASLDKSASVHSLESACSDILEHPEAHLRQVRDTWNLQLVALRQLFEMEGEAPPTLSLLEADLNKFIEAKKELMYSQTRNGSSLVNGLSSSEFHQSNSSASPLSLRSPMVVVRRQESVGDTSPSAASINGENGHLCAGVSTDDEADTHHNKSLSRMTTCGSLSDIRGTSTFILRRRSVQQSPKREVASPLSTPRLRNNNVDVDDMEVIPMTDDMQRTDESIQQLLQADDVVVVCNEPQMGQDHMQLGERFQIISGLPPLGEGTYGRVYRAWDDLVGRYLAAKELPLDESKKRASAVREVLKEYMVLTELDHPNIVRVIAFMVVGKMGRIFMEWMPSGSLQDVLRFSPRGVLRENVVSRYAHDTLHGLVYLHNRGVLHRDVKPGNMLLGSDGTVKLTDFGTSSVLAVGKHTLESDAIMGTAPYMAPEAVQGLYSSASDVWSLGCAVLELVTGRVPWSDPVTGSRMDAVPLLFKIGSLSDTESATINERPNKFIVPESRAGEANEDRGDVVVSDDLADFLKKIFVVNRHARPTAAELLHHPFISSHRAAWEHRQQTLERGSP